MKKSINTYSLNAAEIRLLVRKSINCRKNVLVTCLARKIVEGSGEILQGTTSSVRNGSDWLTISSLSQLRKETGGRFENLKRRWLAAGLPLRKHRGDREEKEQLEEEGWLALTIWIGDQGYDIKLCGDQEAGIFKIRKR
jgi:hypothetical protein